MIRLAFALALLASVPAPALAQAPGPEDRIPHSAVATGGRDVARAWLAEPTTRYAHGVLGDAIEAGALVVETRGGERLIHRLPERFVFEDLTPRLADLDGDGRDEVIVVRADARLGAALVVYGVEGGALVQEAASEPIGRANRWLNPIGAADLDGDGAMEVAWIETPHIGGVLRVASWRDGRLVPRDALRGVSNHALGATALGLHALVDRDGDGTPDIVAPVQARDALVVVDFRGGRLVEAERIALPGRVAGDIRVEGRSLVVPTDRGAVAVPLATGERG
ncbi:VCBS repeat-containing protein [Salinarimonas sp.]|uniref:FG-GAP repeat domain-containing protein n=1 Tax=Salinarimonas sp. TaxID=2766526 RepID=UPI0032D95F63